MVSPDTQRLVATLDEVGSAATTLVGGKAANLGELLRHGFPVPSGFVLTTSASKLFNESINFHAQLAKQTFASPLQLERSAAQLRALIVDAEFPAVLGHAVEQAHQALAARRELIYAVRSSATTEDGSTASFAGQHETYYYVSAGELPTMIKHCWASWWSATATAYRHRHGIAQTSGHMAVICQEQIRSDVSGVTFSVNPATGDTQEIVTEASWGMGAAIVDGRVTPDRYIVRRTDSNIVERRIADKKLMVPPDLSNNQRVRLRDVPTAKRRQPTLLDVQIAEVATRALEAETVFGTPQDIEWAYADGHFFMLQSRPVTTRTQADGEMPPPGRYVIFKPLIENFTEPLTPLTVDLLRAALPPDYTFIRGRIYGDLDRQRRLLPFKVSDQELGEYLYLAQRPDFSALPIDWLKLPLVLTAAALIYLLCGVFLTRTARLPDDFMAPFRDRCQRAIDDENLDASRALLTLGMPYGHFLAAGNMPMQVNLASGRYFFWLLLVRLLIERWCPDLPSDTTALLCAGSTGVKSTHMGHAIAQLAERARAQPRVAIILRETAPAAILPALQTEPQAQDFLAGLDGFLAEHGHRTAKEFELSQPRWAEEPTLVLSMIRNYLLVENLPEAQETHARNRRASLLKRVHEYLSKLPAEHLTNWRGRLVDYCIGRAKYFAKSRENSRYYHIMIWRVLRHKILQSEARLLKYGKLKSKDDVFFLNLDELLGLETSTLDWTDIEPVVHQRRLAYVQECKHIPPRTIGFENQSVSSQHATSTNVMTGQGASPGSYQGRARVIRDLASDAELQPGEILVAPYTDPAWTPLFLTARAAVVEVGSYLSHAGTIAREYGMPCVVDVPDCTSRIATGTLLEVDGSRGTVTLIAESSAQ